MDTQQKIGKMLIKYRKENGLSQSDLAERLNLTQVTISRIENSLHRPSKKTKDKIYEQLSLFHKKLDKYNLHENLQFGNYSWCDYFSFNYRGMDSGDRVSIYKDDEKCIILHCDATGHGETSKIMANYLEVCFRGVVNALPKGLLPTPRILYNALRTVIKETKSFWRGNPSFRLIVLNKNHYLILSVASGMPKTFSLHREWTQKVSGTHDSNDGVSYEETLLRKGNGFFFSYSDGLEEICDIEKLINKHLSSYIKAFKKDMKAIGQKMLDVIYSSIREKKIKDDISFILIRKR